MAAAAAFAVSRAAAQPAAPAAQCNRAQLDLCGQALTECSRHTRDLAGRRDALSTEVASLRRDSAQCVRDGDPTWRTFFQRIIDARLAAYKKPQTPGSCEYMDYEIAATARLVVRARLPDTAAVVRALAELRTQLPGLAVDEGDLKPATACPGPEAAPGWAFEGGRAATRLRDDVTGERRAKLPPASECLPIGTHIDQRGSEAEKRIAAEGFWVIDDGLLARCQKNASGTWETTRIINDQPAAVITRSTQ